MPRFRCRPPALDQGTTSSRAILFDHDGQPRPIAQKEFRQIFPPPAGSSTTPRRSGTPRCAVAAECCGAPRSRPENVAAIGITNQRETTVIWDRGTGQPDPQRHRLAGPPHRRLLRPTQAAGHDGRRPAKTGLVIDAYFSGSKVRWLLDNVPGARRRPQAGQLAFGTIDSWLLWKLTGGTAPRHRREQCLTHDALQHPHQPLGRRAAGSCSTSPGRSCRRSDPPAKSTAKPRRTVRRAHPHRRHGRRPAGGPVRPDLLQPRAGQEHLRHRLLHAHEHRHRGGGIATSAADHRGLATRRQDRVRAGRQRLHRRRRGAMAARRAGALSNPPPEIERLAASVPDAGGVYLVPAFAGLGAPHWDQYARGTITGITRGTTAAHLARRGLGKHRLPGGRRPRRDADKTRAFASRSCAWTAGRPPTTCCCSSRPICCACRWCGRRSRRPRRWEPRTWRGWRSATGRTRGRAGQLGGRAHLRAAHGGGRSRATAAAAGGGAEAIAGLGKLHHRRQ